jgi:hypothetical protein
LPEIPVADYAGVIVGWATTADGYFAGLSQYTNGGYQVVDSSKSNSNWSITVNYAETWNNRHSTWYNWIKLVDDGTNRQIYTSQNGYSWRLFHTVATNDFITPTHVMFGVEARNTGGYPCAVTIDSWEEA